MCGCANEYMVVVPLNSQMNIHLSDGITTAISYIYYSCNIVAVVRLQIWWKSILQAFFRSSPFFPEFSFSFLWFSPFIWQSILLMVYFAKMKKKEHRNAKILHRCHILILFYHSFLQINNKKRRKIRSNNSEKQQQVNDWLHMWVCVCALCSCTILCGSV